MKNTILIMIKLAFAVILMVMWECTVHERIDNSALEFIFDIVGNLAIAIYVHPFSEEN